MHFVASVHAYEASTMCVEYTILALLQYTRAPAGIDVDSYHLVRCGEPTPRVDIHHVRYTRNCVSYIEYSSASATQITHVHVQLVRAVYQRALRPRCAVSAGLILTPRYVADTAVNTCTFNQMPCEVRPAG